MSELENVIQKIRKLVNNTVARGATEAEALLAANKVGELMQAYNLSMNAVLLGQQSCIELSIPTGRKRRHPIDTACVALAGFCDCKIWFHSKRYAEPCSSYKFFGLPTDTTLIQYLYDVIASAIERETEDFQRSPTYRGAYSKKTATVSFQKGMARRISERLEEMTVVRHREEEAATVVPQIAGVSNNTSIVLIKQDKVKDEFEKLGLNLGKAKRSNFRPHNGAFYAGQEAGGRVNLHRAVSGGGKQGMLMAG